MHLPWPWQLLYRCPALRTGVAALRGKIIRLKIAPDEDNAGLKEADNKIGSKDSQLGSKGQRR